MHCLSIEIKDHKFWRFKTHLYNHHSSQNLGTSLHDVHTTYRYVFVTTIVACSFQIFPQDKFHWVPWEIAFMSIY